MALCTIDKKSDTPLYIQIRDCIHQAIIRGDLQPGDKLPPVASLAKEIGVTQATVRRALQDLKEAGHTRCHVGRGTFIQNADQEKDASAGSISPSVHPQGVTTPRPAESTPYEFATRQLRLGVNKALCDIMSLADRPGIINLGKGVPDPGLLPDNFLDDLLSETLAQDSKNLLESSEPLGLYSLRSVIAQRYSTVDEKIHPDQVLITNGSLQGISLMAQSARDTGHTVVCETPCYKGIPEAFSAMGHWVETITRDHEGPIPEQLEILPKDKPSILYLCSYAHNPMGTNLCEKRLPLLLEWARSTSSIVLTDELFKDLCWNLSPGIFNELGADQTVIVSSLSKTVMTGLRLGWIISSKERVTQLSQLKRLTDISTPSLIQGIALTLFNSGRYEEHCTTMRNLYRKRTATMLKTLKKNMPGTVKWSNPDGGYSILLELPEGCSSIALFLIAVERGISFLPGPLFDLDQRFINCIRLSCAWTDETKIKEGVELLADAVKELLNRPRREFGLGGLGGYQ